MRLGNCGGPVTGPAVRMLFLAQTVGNGASGSKTGGGSYISGSNQNQNQPNRFFGNFFLRADVETF